MASTNNQQPQEATRVLADDHSEIDKLIHELLAALDQENKTQSFELLDALWARLAVHIRAEHLCLFPTILDAPRANFTGKGGTPEYEDAQNAIDLLRHDHDFFMRELARDVNIMREHESVFDPRVISRQLRGVRRSIVSVKNRLNTHNRLEENQVYTWVDVLVAEGERSALTARMRREIQNTPPRFRG